MVICGWESGGGFGEFKYVWIKVFLLLLVIIGWSFLVVNVYICLVLFVINNIIWVLVKVDSL